MGIGKGYRDKVRTHDRRFNNGGHLSRPNERNTKVNITAETRGASKWEEASHETSKKERDGKSDGPTKEARRKNG